MRKTILASAAFATLISGYTLGTAGTASAADRAASCAEVVQIATKFNNDIDALNGDDPQYTAKLKKVYKGTSASFTDVAAKADDVELKRTLSTAAGQMDRLSSESDEVFLKTPQDKNSEFMQALAKVDSACPTP
ncbi:hypothetical protein [Nocardia suismassiliense]|uniref:hypothetical protein n=1 Tax=Nocardia suismassiliense TaxID=2077092 RepID=UPI000D1D7485|nr:hypothetical protein [Nocardia suismassiliense]